MHVGLRNTGLANPLRESFTPTELFPTLNTAGIWYPFNDPYNVWVSRTGLSHPSNGGTVGLVTDRRFGGLLVKDSILPNQDFSDGTVTGWNGVGTSVSNVSIGPGAGNRAMRVTITGAAEGRATYALPTVIGTRYWLFPVLVTYPGNVQNYRVRVGTTDGGSELMSVSGVGGTTDYPDALSFEATTTTTYLSFFVTSTNNGDFIDFDNVYFTNQPGFNEWQGAPNRPLFHADVGASYTNWDGVDDSIPCLVNPGFTSNMDAFFLYRRTDTAVGNCFMHTNDNVNYFGNALSGNLTSTANGVGASGTYFVNGNSVADTQDALHTALALNTWVVYEARNLDLSAWTTFRIGSATSTLQLKGDIQEVIVCPAQSATNRGRIRRYLGSKVGLAL